MSDKNRPLAKPTVQLENERVIVAEWRAALVLGRHRRPGRRRHKQTPVGRAGRCGQFRDAVGIRSAIADAISMSSSTVDVIASMAGTEYRDVHAIDQPELRKTFRSLSKMKAWFAEHGRKPKGEA